MSLFGGDLRSSSSPHDESDFSISPIPSTPVEYVQAAPDARDPFSESQEDDLHDSNLSGSDALDEDERQSESEFRTNRFRGTNTAWKYHTREERLLAASLDQLRADDLGKHLYNTHAIKSRLRKRVTSPTARQWQRKNGWIDKDPEGHRPWHPDNAWTAWPLEPDLVPRAGERFGTEKYEPHRYTYSMYGDPRPRTDLAEELFAIAMRLAKCKWDARPEEGPQQSDRITSRDQWQPAPRSRSSRSRSASLGPKAKDIADEEEVSDSADNACGSSTPRRGIAEPAIRPVISADESRLKKIVQPSVNAVLSRLDELLLSLHSNRLGHHSTRKDGESISGASSRSVSRSRSRSRSGRRPPKPSSRKRSIPSQPESELPDTADVAQQPRTKRHKRSNSSFSLDGRSERSQSVTSSSSEQSRGGNHNLNLRDWSEVLGAAALSGWEPTILERAARRCTALFGESMSFRTFPDRTSAPSGPSTTEQTTELEQVLASDPSLNQASIITNDLEVYRCPEETCRRHIQPFTRSHGYRFRDHLKRAHGYSTQDVRDLELASHPEVALSLTNKVNPRGWNPPDPLVCPHVDCARALAPFPESRRLIDHLKRAHKYDPRKESPPRQTSPLKANMGPTLHADSLGGVKVELENELVGGVHNDGFLRHIGPFTSTKGRGMDKTRVQSDD